MKSFPHVLSLTDGDGIVLYSTGETGMVMEQGRAYDIGRHEDLLHRCDIYKHMWHQQNRHIETSSHVRPLVARS